LERGFGGGLIDFSSGANLSVVADTAQQAIRDPGSAPGAAGNFAGASIINGNVQDFCRALDDNLQVLRGVELQAQHNAKART
jgi:hypothetical protein